MTLARFSTQRLPILHSCKLVFTWYHVQKDHTQDLCHTSRSKVMDGHLNWVSYPQTDSKMCLNSIWAYSISFLSGQQYALRSAEFGGYETVSNTNTPMYYYCLTTVSHPCVSLILQLSYTSEERHLLRQRPQGSWHWTGELQPGQFNVLRGNHNHLGSMMTRVHSLSKMPWDGRAGRGFCLIMADIVMNMEI